MTYAQALDAHPDAVHPTTGDIIGQAITPPEGAPGPGDTNYTSKKVLHACKACRIFRCVSPQGWLDL